MHNENIILYLHASTIFYYFFFIKFGDQKKDMQSLKENLLNNTFIRYMYIKKIQINGQKYIDKIYLYNMLFI